MRFNFQVINLNAPLYLCSLASSEQIKSLGCSLNMMVSMFVPSGKKDNEDLAILFTNRAAAHLKDGNCGECVKDCTM